MHSVELLTTFINERTGLNRNTDGSLQPQAGLIDEAESVLQDHMRQIIKANKENLKQVKDILLALKETTAEHHQEMLKYYMYIVDKIATTGGTDVIKEMISALDRTLFGIEEKSTRTEETLKRRRNVLQSFQQKQRDFLQAEKKQNQMDTGSPHDHHNSLPESRVTFRSQTDWTHAHSEL
ncbi:protein disulfide-isomerase domain [Elysia marginata]|uniref:Protein disulfide-isomerase domain n=1 Tax=Elysia marginata TaxID=1093978 RepID=A0AAV4JTB8_9GAST|nr:protein disulfide-isomerase domain [Elysia marginata]